jgi:hypothetical protein
MTPEQQRAIAIAEARKKQAMAASAASHPAFDESKVPASQRSQPSDGGIMDKIGAFAGSALEGLPVVGPAFRDVTEDIGAGLVAPFSDQTFSQVKAQMHGANSRNMAENPGTSLAGSLTGAIGGSIPMLAAAPAAFGVTGPSLALRAGASAASNAALAGGDTAARGGDLGDILKSAGIGLGTGLATPLASEGLTGLYNAAKDAIGPRINALIRPTEEAQRRVGQAVANDVPAVAPADQASAAINQQPLRNVDLGGEQTRALLRSAANNDPEARGNIQRFAQDRFENQGPRAQTFISRLMNGQTDDLALQDSIRAKAKAANRPAYQKAYQEGSEVIVTPELQRLMGSPAVVAAMKKVATGTGRNRAIAEGYGAFNPGVSVTDDGRVIFNRTKAGGAPVYPDLQFWDYTKRELDDMVNAARQSGSRDAANSLGTIRNSLRDELDNIVPSYKNARQGAASFFGAEDALDAGRKFVTQNKTVPETQRALMKMSKAERDAFATGFASELKDTIAATRDRTNVIDRIFGSQQSRDKIKLALGPERYKQFEAFVNVENGMDMLRNALGNSTTARQLKELGLAGAVGAGTGYMTGDWKTGLASALVVRGARAAGTKVDTTLAKTMADLLLSDDPKKINIAVQLAAKSPKALATIKYLRRGLMSLGPVGAIEGSRAAQ